MALIERFARGVVETLGKDDFRRIMNETLDHMLNSMSKRDRLRFCEDLVDHSVEQMLTGLSNEEKMALFQSMLPRILQHFPAEELATMAAKPTPPPSS